MFTSALIKALQQVAPVIDSKSSRPSVTDLCVQIQIRDQTCIIRAGNQSTQIYTQIPNIEGEAFEGIFSHKLLTDFLKVCPESIELSGNAQRLIIKCKDSMYYEFGSMPIKFQPIPKLETAKAEIQIDGQELVTALKAALKFVSTQKIDTAIAGIHFVAHNNKATITASDGYCYTQHSLTVKGDNCSFILSDQLAHAVVKSEELRQACAQPINVNIFQEFIQVKSKNICIVSCYSNQQYPALPLQRTHQSNWSASVQRSKLTKIVQSLIQPKLKLIWIELDSVNQMLYCSNDLGSLQLPGQISQSTYIQLNAKYLIKVLQSIKTSEVLLEITHPEQILTLKPMNRSETQYGIMPIKLSQPLPMVQHQCFDSTNCPSWVVTQNIDKYATAEALPLERQNQAWVVTREIDEYKPAESIVVEELQPIPEKQLEFVYSN
ncbi:hypothetical protein ACQ4M3_13070 [Leptolyngbya sp. AN03gr2]|uniref:hypothetical protein n=1 Tax=unclassified Leptolyngbya TaxID=2650499 RepID=UPI003D311AD1